ncbi:hypothetical protein [Marinomonas sp. 2405UD68-3]|uniref:hypothetical protein n=1 Tax=Marinomonas sp. 2405UD68-3 TaxID=3391835 RepID=UPI0039C95AEA
MNYAEFSRLSLGHFQAFLIVNPLSKGVNHRFYSCTIHVRSDKGLFEFGIFTVQIVKKEKVIFKNYVSIKLYIQVNRITLIEVD